VPFNFQTFRTRALTALLFVAVMLIGLLWNFWSFLILFTVIHFGCWYEYLKLVEKIYSTKVDIVIKWLFGICGFTMMMIFGWINWSFDIAWTPFGAYISFKILFWALLIICLITFLLQNKQIPEKAKWMSFAGLVYISLSFTLFLNLRDNIFFTNEEFSMIDMGRLYVCGIVFSIWINDTSAYLVGSFIGKTPLTKISPKKTVEGTIGGAILCVIVISLLAYYIPVAKVIDVEHRAIIASLCAIFGTLGDLFESKLKRMADVKDSGSFMPGHGGFLDRFDSLLFAVPAVWVYVKLFL
jgi:phosphatidate cytidylyltransferase